MSEPLMWVLAAAMGCVLGAVFFGGLWWTVRKGVHPGDRRSGSSAACWCAWALSSWASILSGVVTGSGWWPVSWDS